MDIVGIKVSVIFGLLCFTFGAFCLPLLLTKVCLAKKKKSQNICDHSSDVRSCPCCSPEKNRKRKPSNVPEAITETVSEQLYVEIEENNGHARESPVVLDLMNCFSGGVFLGTSFLALMPEIRKIFDDVGVTWPQFYKQENITEIEKPTDEMMMPITEIVVTSGIFLILCLEQVVYALMDGEKQKSVTVTDETSRNRNGEVIKTSVESEILISETQAINLHESLEDSGRVKGHDMENLRYTESLIRSMILVATLSIHSILEGIAIGLQNKISSALSIFFAVMFHKSLMSFSMSNNLIQSGQSPKFVLISGIIFSIMSPIGVAIGIVMKEGSSGNDIIHGVLQGIATGTFIFITFFEVLAKEFGNHSNRILKIIMFILGYLCILGIMLIQHGFQTQSLAL